MIRVFPLVWISILILVGCSSSDSESAQAMKKNGSLETTILSPAGELYEPFSELEVPTFFNVGSIKDSTAISQYRSIVMGERLAKGQKVAVQPLVLFSFRAGNETHQYIVSSYISQENKKMGSDFNAFMSINSDLQMAIEHWFRSHCEMGQCRDYQWTHAYKALRKLK